MALGGLENMPNCLIKGIQDKLWVNYYEDIGNELYIYSVYLDSDPNRTNIIDYLSESVTAKADTSMRKDWAEVEAEFSDYRGEH